MEPKELKEEIARVEGLIKAQNILHDRIARALRLEIHDLTFRLQKECKHPDMVAVTPIGFSCWSWEPILTCQNCGKEFHS